MWDVKQQFIQAGGNTNAFYLNYVGCKDDTTIVLSITLTRFTLTMWDVK